jgi:hypothetical protein
MKTGQIIDFRSMINEATKINFEEGHDNTVIFLLNFRNKDKINRNMRH